MMPEIKNHMIDFHRHRCDVCQKIGTIRHRFSTVDPTTGAKIVVTGVTYDQCPKCGTQWVPGEVFLTACGKRLQELVEKWLFRKVKSFSDIDRWFVPKKRAIKYIVGHKPNSEEFYTKKWLDENLRLAAFHFHLFGEEYYLKASICRCCIPGLASKWRFDEGYHDEIVDQDGF